MLDFSLRRFVQRWTRSMGIVVAKTATIHSEIEAVAVSRFLDLYKIELVLDIGANAGQYASMLRDRVNYRGQIVFCEPISHHVNKMRRDGASDNNWVIEHCAVSFNEEVSTFSIMKGDEMSSLASPTTAETGLFAQINEVFEKVDVRCTTVDALLAGHAVGAREGTVYLKIDTQGWEKNVLAGVSDFGAIACVQMEFRSNAFRSCPQTWCKSVVGHCALRRVWPVCQSATAGKLTMALSLKGAMVSSVM